MGYKNCRLKILENELHFIICRNGTDRYPSVNSNSSFSPEASYYLYLSCLATKYNIRVLYSVPHEIFSVHIWKFKFGDLKKEGKIITHEFQNPFKNDNKEKFKIQFQVRRPTRNSFSVIKRRYYIEPPSDKYYPHSQFQHTQVKRLNDDNEIQNDIEESERAKVRAEQEILKELTKARLTSEAKLLDRILHSRNNTYKKHDSNGLNKRKTRYRMFKHKKFTPFKNKAFARKKLLVEDSPFGSIDEKKAGTDHFHENPVSQNEKNHTRNFKQSFPHKLERERQKYSKMEQNSNIQNDTTILYDTSDN
ncbi:hypothetical protein TNIN_195431 [Trichonephila inaurata madagascariensis]|uniref:Uncharacterized protein n=1 Tax=Trichonephila inaurata madagascariensis TaxID=2747483 RepID=A0A8X6YS90_9ARAC|nr:hypothetical protein TNIN_195431 [Trichonephila inaurata madagascariensis]